MQDIKRGEHLLSIHQGVYQRLHRTLQKRANEFESLVIMNFDHAYQEQDFYQDLCYHWIDCTKIPGTNCYCDEEAKTKLRDAIKELPLHGIHYIDSGNYHYVSELWLEKAEEPFVLVVFDHHTDMQASMFDSLLSCGCWVKQVIDTNPHLKQVILIGPKESLVQEIPSDYKNLVECYSENTCSHDRTWKKYFDQYFDVPVYISIDKDVLSKEDAVTNWDQGSMTLEELETLLHYILEKHEILGIDICGEYIELDQVQCNQSANQQNNQVNEELLEFIITES